MAKNAFFIVADTRVKIAFNTPPRPHMPLLNNFKAAKQKSLQNDKDRKSQDVLACSLHSMFVTPIHLDKGSKLDWKAPYEELHLQACC